MNSRAKLALVLLALTILPAIEANASEVSNQADICADILLVYARGSSDNPQSEYLDQPFGELFNDKEKTAGTFFRTFKTLLDRDYPHITYKAQSVHDFPNKYSPVGYRAVSIFQFVPPNLNNALEAEWSGWAPGEYRDSVQSGKSEVVGYVRDQISACPNQQIVMGGYSQGADVIAQSIFDFTQSERTHIGGVALFGDPKFNGSYKDSSGNFQFYPWKRGTSPQKKGGIADPRSPYTPDDMKKKVISWCFDDDFVCTGYSTAASRFAKTLSIDDVGVGHKRYTSYGVPDAASEIVQGIAPTLYALDKSRGGVDKGAGPVQPVPYVPNTKPIDVMFVVDVSYNVDDVISQLRTQTDSIMAPMGSFFNGVRYGFAYYNEVDSGGTLLPRYVVGQQPQIFQSPSSPIFSSTLTTNLISKLAWRGLSGGGADVPDPHGVAIEKASFGTYWDPRAIKHIVLITDRPIKESFTYNICNSSIQTEFVLPDLKCYTDPTQSTALTYMHPELCDKVWLAITSEQCKLNMTTPGYVHNITRTLDDAINVAQSQRTDVSIVVPHGLTGTVTDKPAAEKRLEYFAKATGGLYMKYDVFGRADYSDMIWRVLNHQPKEIALAYKDALDLLGPTQALSPATKIKAKTNVPVVFDVSRSAHADNYKWDFDGNGSWDQATESPNTQHTFSSPSTNQFVHVAAYKGAEEQARTSLPLIVEQYSGPVPSDSSPYLPEDLKAKINSSGDIEITWTAGEQNTILLFKDPDTGMPIISIRADLGRAIISRNIYLGEELKVSVSTDSGDSESIVLDVEPMPAIVIVAPPPIIILLPEPIVLLPPPIEVIDDPTPDHTPPIELEQPDLPEAPVTITPPDYSELTAKDLLNLQPTFSNPPYIFEEATSPPAFVASPPPQLVAPTLAAVFRNNLVPPVTPAPQVLAAESPKVIAQTTAPASDQLKPKPNRHNYIWPIVSVFVFGGVGFMAYRLIKHP